MPRSLRSGGGCRLALIALACGPLLAGCGEGANMLDPHGVGARDIAGLFWVIFWMAAGVFVVVEGLLIFAIFRFRNRGEARLPTQVQGNRPLEITWTILPLVVLFGVLIATFNTMKAVASPVPNALQVEVIGHQWWWEFQYPDQKVVTAGELHLPLNQPVTLHIKSADVLHNFWVPELDRKVQALPGHDNIIPIMATQSGTYHGFCAEFCGLEHAMMRFEVVVQPGDQFTTWLQGQAQPPVQPTTAAQQAGAKAFAGSGCATCHQIGSAKPPGFPSNGNIIIGPNLSHVGSRGVLAGDIMANTPQDMAHWLQAPDTMKPGNLMTTFIHNGQLSQQQVQDLTAYLESLK